MAATHLDVGLRCIKYLLFAVNALFMLTGLMMILVGTKSDRLFEDFNRILGTFNAPSAKILIAVGIFVLVVAFFGCCGAIKESTCMVLVFAVSLSFVLILEIAAAITAFAYQRSVGDYLTRQLLWMFNAYDYNVPETTEAIDFLQSRLHCCGIHGPDDWQMFRVKLWENLYPMSCCVSGEPIAKSHDSLAYCNVTFQNGCLDSLVMLLHRNALNLGTAAIAIALIQFTGIMFACTLGRAIRRQKTLREQRRWEFREQLVAGYQPLGKNDPQTTFPVVYMQPEFTPKTTSDC